MREDRYFIAGRTIAVSLVHGGPPAGFLSPTLFSCLVDGPELATPVLEDVADRDLQEKIKRVTFSSFFKFNNLICICMSVSMLVTRFNYGTQMLLFNGRS